VNRPWSVSIAAAVVGFGATVCGVAGAVAPATEHSSRPPAAAVTKAPNAPAGAGKRSHDGFFLRLSLGAVYLHESWNPSGGSPGAVFGGGGTSLEASIGKSVRPGLIVGGLWKIAAVIDPNESYLGTTYIAPGTARLLDVVAAFVDYYPNPRRGFHFGGSVGVVTASNVDSYYGTVSTGWGAAASGEVGYETFFSNRWSVGVLAGLAAYRYWDREAAVSSMSDGLLSTLALSFSFE
jgi:hypothetical protein